MTIQRVLFILFILAAGGLQAQSNKDGCGIVVVDVTSTSLFGYLNAYTVTLKNTNQYAADGIYFRAVFYNNEGRKIETLEEAFNSSTIVDPIGSGVSKVIIRSPNIKGASKVVIQIDRAHFVNGDSCK